MDTQTFNTIRRAASVARRYDERYRFFVNHATKAMGHLKDKSWDIGDALVEIESSVDSAWVEMARAEAVREAIRAAIGSDKA